MTYSLTEKLNFADNPQIEIQGKKITVKADAVTVLELLDILNTKGETQAALEAAELLFSPRDQKTIQALNLQFADYVTLLTTAISLALGEDPDDTENPEA